jgi:hypothetical protein
MGDLILRSAGGWKPHTPQTRSRIFKSVKSAAGIFDGVTPAPSSDLTWQNCLLDQLNLGSCTAQDVAQAMFNAQVRAGVPVDQAILISRLFAYYGGRAKAGEEAVDAGSQVSTVFDAAAAIGVPAERFWAYEVARFAEMPDTEAFRQAHAARMALGVEYVEFGDVSDPVTLIRKALTAGYTVQFGSEVTRDYTDGPPTAVIRERGLPSEGGHAQSACGHDDDGEFVIVSGSWGDYRDPNLACRNPAGCTRWGYDYVTSRFRDLCCVLKAPLLNP